MAKLEQTANEEMVASVARNPRVRYHAKAGTKRAVIVGCMEVHNAARKAEDGPPPTMEQLARIAREGAPRPVTAKEMNPQSGKITWPSALQDKIFVNDREALEQVMEKKAKYGGLSFSDQMQARETIENMSGALRANIATMPPQEYTTSKSFLNSMLYATCKGQLQ